MAASRYKPGRVALERALSKLRLASRRDARLLVRGGRVQVNGRTVTDPLAAVSPERDAIEVDRRRVVAPAWRTIALHKPRGYVTTRRDPEGRPTVFDLLGADAAGLAAVGRLDLASSGLLLLTTDTQLAERLTNPASGLVRRYVVTVRGELGDEHCAAMVRGRGGLKAASARVIKRSRRETHLIVELTEGKNREIRRLIEHMYSEFQCEKRGQSPFSVSRLLRVAYGPIELGTLQPGRWREVTSGEVARL
ncbi:MAG TPA: pseudouridine synthase [Vicinamibacterales bacterium]|nr:pseudouridine synthase [Vicinamibacterales bacterium]